MPFMPAVCYSCHTIFSSDLFVRDIQTDLSGVEAKYCPSCSGKGRILGGLYEFIDFTLSVLEDRQRHVSDLQQLHYFINEARFKRLSANDLTKTIAQEQPEFAELLILLPDTNPDYRLSLNLLSQVLLAVLELSLDDSFYINHVKVAQGMSVTQVIDQIYTHNTGVAKRFL